MAPLPRIQGVVRRRHRPSREAKDGIESRHRIPSPVEAEDVLVEVGLKVVLGDGSVVGAHDPRFKIGKDEVDHRQVGVRFFGIVVQYQAVVLKANWR